MQYINHDRRGEGVDKEFRNHVQAEEEKANFRRDIYTMRPYAIIACTYEKGEVKPTRKKGSKIVNDRRKSLDLYFTRKAFV